MQEVSIMMPEVTRMLQKECRRLLKTRAINLEIYEGMERRLGKIVLSVALENIAKRYKSPPWTKSFDRDREHLKFF